MENDLIIRCSYIDKLSGNALQLRDLDTEGNIPFRLDISAIENGSIGNVFGISSQTFTLPGTKNNNAFFKSAYNINAASTVGMKNSIDCKLIQGSNTIFKGKLILNEVITDFHGNTNYQVQLVNETLDFTNLIRNQFVSQLNFNDLDHAYTFANITGSWAGSLLSGKVFYPFMDLGVDGTDTTVPDVAFGGQSGKIDNQTTPMKVTQFKPAVKLKTVMDKIFESVAYDYSSSFMDSADFNNIYLLTTANDKLGIQNTSAQDAGFIAKRTTSQTITANTSLTQVLFPSEVYDPGNSYNTGTSKFTVTNDGTYAFKSDLLFSRVLANDEDYTYVEVYVRKNGVTIANELYDITTIDQGTITFTSAGFPLVNGDQIELRIDYFNTNLISPSTNLSIAANSQFQTLYAPAFIVGGTVNMEQQFDPQLKSLDLLQAIIQKFNLVIEPKRDEQNVLVIEPFDTWVDAGQVKDWTFKFDEATRSSIKHPIQNQPQIIVFGDEEDTDILNDYSKKNFDNTKTYGSYTFLADSDIAQGEKKIGKLFAPLPINSINGGTQVIVPHLYTKDGSDKKTFKFKPRLGYKADNQSVLGAANNKIWVKDTGAATSFNSYSTLSSVNALPAISSSYSLHYDATKWYPFHQNYKNGQTINGAFNQYWGRYIAELYDDEARLLTCNMKFNQTDLYSLRLNDKIFVKDAYYRINKISGFNLSEEDSVQVELLKAPVSKLKFRRSSVLYSNGVSDIIAPGDFNPVTGVVTYYDITGSVVTDPVVLKPVAANDGYKFISGSVYYLDVYNPYINSNKDQVIYGDVLVDPKAGNVIGVAASSSVGQGVDKVLILGTDLDIKRDVQNSFIGGDSILVDTSANNISVFSSKDINVSPNANGVVVMASSGSTIEGSFNTIISSQNAFINEAAAGDSIQSNIIGSEGIQLVGDTVSYIRHTHIGGDDSTFYQQIPNYSVLKNTVGLGNLANDIDLLLYPTSSQVFLGNTIQGGAVRMHSHNLLIYSGSPIMSASSHDYANFIQWSGSNTGYGKYELPPIQNNEGRVMQFFTDGTIAANKYLNIVPYGTYTSTPDSTIEGDPEYPINTDYQGVTMVCHGDVWFVTSVKK